MEDLDYFDPVFYYRQKQFTGGGGNVLFDAVDFRRYLNRFFTAGTTSLTDNDDIHWVFTTSQGCGFNSCHLGHQPYWLAPTWDSHCTIFSLYYEVRLSPLRLPVGNLKWLDLEAFDECQYLDNIIVLYEMLVMLFSYQPFITYIEAFHPWSGYGHWAGALLQVARDQVRYLFSFQNRLIRQGRCNGDPFSEAGGYYTCVACDEDAYYTCLEG